MCRDKPAPLEDHTVLHPAVERVPPDEFYASWEESINAEFESVKPCKNHPAMGSIPCGGRTFTGPIPRRAIGGSAFRVCGWVSRPDRLRPQNPPGRARPGAHRGPLRQGVWAARQPEVR